MMRLFHRKPKPNPHTPVLEYHLGLPSAVLARFSCTRCLRSSVEIVSAVRRGEWRGCTALPVPAQAPERDAASLPAPSCAHTWWWDEQHVGHCQTCGETR